MSNNEKTIIPKPIKTVAESFGRLPGIGPLTALRLAFYILHVPQGMLEAFAEALVEIKKQTKKCSTCLNVTVLDPCPICVDKNRDMSIICVVEHPLDVLAIERSGQFNGVYHVLHGAISPLNNIGPDEICIAELKYRIKTSRISEVILATNSNMEGEATAMYIAREINVIKDKMVKKFKVTRLGQGLPTGADLEYADDLTVLRAMEGRRDY